MEARSKTVDSATARPGATPSTRLPSHHNAKAWFFAEAAAVVALIATSWFMPGGMLTAHMAAHIVAMSVAAPLCAWMLRQWTTGHAAASRLLLATGVQLAVFFIWHSPPAMMLAMQSALAHSAMIAGLFAVSVWFWTCVLRAIRTDRLEAIAALLVTGKLVCLIAALLVFAPRLLYPGGMVEAAMMGDQQLAGLIMLTACPLTYVGASVLIVARWFLRLSAGPAQAGG